MSCLSTSTDTWQWTVVLYRSFHSGDETARLSYGRIPRIKTSPRHVTLAHGSSDACTAWFQRRRWSHRRVG